MAVLILRVRTNSLCALWLTRILLKELFLFDTDSLFV